jgi:hypothetical protein
MAFQSVNSNQQWRAWLAHRRHCGLLTVSLRVATFLAAWLARAGSGTAGEVAFAFISSTPLPLCSLFHSLLARHGSRLQQQSARLRPLPL